MKDFIIKLLNNCNNLDIIIGSRNKSAFDDWQQDKIIHMELNNLDTTNTIKLFDYFVEDVFKNSKIIGFSELEDLIKMDKDSL